MAQLDRTVSRGLDRLVAGVVRAPLDVPDAPAAIARIEHFDAALTGALGSSAAGFVVTRGLARLSRTSMRWVPSARAVLFAIPVATAASATMHTIRVLCSLLVQRLRRAGLPVEETFVRRVALNLLLDPTAGSDAARPNRTAAPRLASRWLLAALPVGPGHVRAARRAAEAIDRLDLPAALAASWAAERVLDAPAS